MLYMLTKKDVDYKGFFYFLVAIMVLVIIDGVFKLAYEVKAASKLLVFGVVPLLAFRYRKGLKARKNDVKKALYWGLGVYLLIILAYLLTRSFIDYSNITTSLTGDIGVTKDKFIYVALYIALINSFLEEYFFRGFAMTLFTKRMLSGLVSSVAFAFYHIGMMITWFSPGILILLITGLVMAGMFFVYLNWGKDHIYTSWLVHLFANLAINTIGLHLFGYF